MNIAPATNVRRERVIVFGAIGVMLLITLPLANILNIWIDEAYTLHTTSDTFAFAIKSAREFEMQPALYFAELWVWRQLSDSITLARLNSVFFAAAAVWFTYLAARRWLVNVPPALVAVLYAINGYLLWSAVEIRPYSLVQLLCAILLVLFHDGFYVEKPRRAAQILYALAALTALYIYYFLGFMLVAATAPLLLERRWKPLVQYVAWMALVGVAFLPEILMARQHMEMVTAVKGAPAGILRTLEYVGGHVYSMPFGMPPLPKLVRWGAGLVMAVATAGSLVMLRGRLTPKTRALWGILVVLCLFYGGVVHSIMREDDLTERHLMILIIPSALALLSVTGLYTGRARRVALGGFAALWIAFNGYCIYYMFHPLAKAGDYRRVAKYLSEHQRPGDPVAVATSHAELPFRHYYLGTGPICPLPYEDTYDRYVIERWRFDSLEQARESLKPAITADGVLWLFTDRGADAEFFGVDLNFEYLEQVLGEDFDLVSEQDFFLAKVRQFEVRTKPDQSLEMTNAGAPPSAPPHRNGSPPRRNDAAGGVFGSPAGVQPAPGGPSGPGDPR